MSFGVQASVAPAPSTSRFGKMKLRAARYVGLPDDDDALALAGDGVNDAIAKLNTRVWYWSITFQDIGLVTGQSDYRLVTDFKAARIIEWINGEGQQAGTCKPTDPGEFRRRFPTATHHGTPRTYIVDNSTDSLVLSLSAPPSQSFVERYPVMRHRYYRRVQEMVSDSDTLIVPSEVRLYVARYAQWVVARRFDPSVASVAKAEANEVWDALKTDDNQHHFHNWS